MNEVVVIGAGANGLACAVTLAGHGRKVTVLERRAAPGGLSSSRALTGGFTIPGVRHGARELRPAMVSALGLEGHGLSLVDAPDVVFASDGDGPGLLLDKDGAAAHDEVARHSPRDAERYRALRAFIAKVTPILDDVESTPAPPLLPHGVKDVVTLSRTALALRALGRDDMTELLRMIPMCVGDVVRERFDTELLGAALALPAVLGDFVGPWSPGTGAAFMLGEARRGRLARGGPAAVVDALGRALTAAGGTIRTSAEVARVLVDDGAVRGVTLVSGEEVRADVVVAACDPKQLLTALLPPLSLSMSATASARAIRTRGIAAKVHLGLDAPLRWRSRPDLRVARAVVAPRLDAIERCFDDAKYRRFAAAPVLDVWIPSVDDPALAPSGGDVVSLTVHGVPFDLAMGWSEETREALREAVLDVLEAHAPGVRRAVVAHEVLTPLDLEEEYGATGGSLAHVERALDQLAFLRPTRELARHTTPVRGLFAGSSGTHGGPGLTLAPGVLAARAVLG